jgi:hypothetical protein
MQEGKPSVHSCPIVTVGSQSFGGIDVGCWHSFTQAFNEPPIKNLTAISRKQQPFSIKKQDAAKHQL